MSEWISIAEAARIVGRNPSQLYRWVEKGILRATVNAHGVMEVSGQDALKVESVTKRGRPKGTARPNYGQKTRRNE